MLSTLRGCSAFSTSTAITALCRGYHQLLWRSSSRLSVPYDDLLAMRRTAAFPKGNTRLFSINKQSNQKRLKKKELQDTVNHKVNGKPKKKGGEEEERSEEQALLEDEGLVDGLVIERLGDRLLVTPLDVNIPQRPQHYLCMQRNYLAAQHIVPGDRVKFKLDAASDQSSASPSSSRSSSSSSSASNNTVGMVSTVHSRLNVLQRTAIGSSVHKVVLKNIAANIDVLCVLVASRPLVPLHTIDNYVTYAEIMQIPKVMLLVNKADLPDTDELFESLQFYRKSPLDIEILKTSVTTKEGIDELLAKIRSKTTIFVGQSGVGKSSLIRCLLPTTKLESVVKEEIRVGDLVKNDLYGAHTTSNARLYRIPLPQEENNQDTFLIDSPGIRELSVAQFPPDMIVEGFREIEESSQHCKFRNCNHFLNDVRDVPTLLEDEAAVRQCAILRGLQQDDISIHRYESLRHLMQQSLRK